MVCKEDISCLLAKDVGYLLMTCKMISKFVIKHVWHHLIKKAFSSSRYHSSASIYHSVVCIWPITAMFQGCSWSKTSLDQNLTKKCLLDTINADVNNVLDDKSTIIKTEECCNFRKDA